MCLRVKKFLSLFLEFVVVFIICYFFITFYIPAFRLMEKPGGYDWFIASLKTAVFFKIIVSSIIAGVFVYKLSITSSKIESKKKTLLERDNKFNGKEKYINYFVLGLFFITFVLLFSLLCLNADISYDYCCYILGFLLCLVFFRSLFLNNDKTYMNSLGLYSIIYFLALFGMFYFNYKEPSYYLFTQNGLLWYGLNFVLLTPVVLILVIRDGTYKSYWHMGGVLFLISIMLELIRFVLGIDNFGGSLMLNTCGGLLFLYFYNKVLCKFRLTSYYPHIEKYKNVFMTTLLLIAVMLILVDYKNLLSLYVELLR